MSEPLRTVEFHILLALAEENRHGYAILQEAQKRAGKAAITLEAGTLYRALRRLREAGLVGAANAKGVPDDDERRRYYSLTVRGRQAAADEAERLAALVREARTSGLLGRVKA
jgi:DNA-binding PadR family transcriptional regulator